MSQVYMVNSYTFTPLLSEMKQLGLVGCGTMAANRHFYPKEMKSGATWRKTHTEEIKAGKDLLQTIF